MNLGIKNSNNNLKDNNLINVFEKNKNLNNNNNNNNKINNRQQELFTLDDEEDDLLKNIYFPIPKENVKTVKDLAIQVFFFFLYTFF